MPADAWLWLPALAAVWVVWGFILGVGARACLSAFRARGEPQ